MNEGARTKSIIATIGIIGASALGIGLISPALTTQKPSDCTQNQVYNSETSRCRDMTSSEIAARDKEALDKKIKSGKQDGSICLSAAEAWSNIGTTTCVAFHPSYFYRTGDGYLFIDEKQNYKDGFVAFFVYKNMLSWDDFLARYKTSGMIAVSGTIVSYEGHPEIKIYNLSQITSAILVNCNSSYGCVYKKGSQL